MDKGIRPYTIARFNELNAQRLQGVYGPVSGDWYQDREANKTFRRLMLADISEAFGIDFFKVAPSHYNHALQAARVANPDSVKGLCRPDDKKGGRKRKVVETAAGPVIIDIYDDEGMVNTDALPIDDAVDENWVYELQETACVLEVAEPEQTVFAVKRSKDGELVAGELSFEEATSMVQRARAAKKAKLYWV